MILPIRFNYRSWSEEGKVDEYSGEAQIDILQALKRALYFSVPQERPILRKPTFHIPHPHMHNAVSEMLATRDIVKQAEKKVNLDKSGQKLVGIVEKSHDILFKCQTVFP